VEIVIVLGVFGVTAAVAVPSVRGFFSQGESRAFETDQRMLQGAVDAWRTDIVNRATSGWPTVSGIQGALADGSNDGIDLGTDSTVIKISLLSTAGSIVGNDRVKSFAYSTSPPSGTGATNSPVGSYVWYVDSNGLVNGRYWTDSITNVGRIDAGELAASDGPESGVYP
jgi:type II secretory pathway pseudopilin PulG